MDACALRPLPSDLVVTHEPFSHFQSVWQCSSTAHEERQRLFEKNVCWLSFPHAYWRHWVWAVQYCTALKFGSFGWKHDPVERFGLKSATGSRSPERGFVEVGFTPGTPVFLGRGRGGSAESPMTWKVPSAATPALGLRLKVGTLHIAPFAQSWWFVHCPSWTHSPWRYPSLIRLTPSASHDGRHA